MSPMMSNADRAKLPEDAMLNYIKETPSVLQNIVDGRKEDSREFTEKFVR